jgi:ABC-type multidrug transport system permease subunit
MKKVLFQEKQMFSRVIAGIITAFTASILIFSLFMIQKEDPEALPWIIIVYIFSMLPVLIIFFVGVEIKITEEGVFYKVLPFNKKSRFLAKADIQLSYEQGTVARKMGRYGIKKSGNYKYYMIGIHNIVIRQGKKTIMIGTNKPQEFKWLLEKYSQDN